MLKPFISRFSIVSLYLHMLVSLSRVFLEIIRVYPSQILLCEVPKLTLSIIFFEFFLSFSGDWLSASNFEKSFGHFSGETFSFVVDTPSFCSLCSFTIAALNCSCRLKQRIYPLEFRETGNRSEIDRQLTEN